jgi:hypothetical protein
VPTLGRWSTVATIRLRLEIVIVVIGIPSALEPELEQDNSAVRFKEYGYRPHRQYIFLVAILNHGNVVDVKSEGMLSSMSSIGKGFTDQ